MTDAVETAFVLIDRIRIDGGTQPREEIDLEQVAEYAEQMAAGATFPAIAVYWDGANYWLADGFHRYHAARKNKATGIMADIWNGTQRDAVLHSVGANATHGKRRSRVDVQRAIDRLLNDAEWSQWSDRAIAEKVGCSDKTVAARRPAKVESGAEIPHLRKGADGKNYPVKGAQEITQKQAAEVVADRLASQMGAGVKPADMYVMVQPILGIFCVTYRWATEEAGRVYLGSMGLADGSYRLQKAASVNTHYEMVAADEFIKRVKAEMMREMPPTDADLRTGDEYTDSILGLETEEGETGEFEINLKEVRARHGDQDQAFVDEWAIGEKVRVEGSDVVGEIIKTDVMSGSVCVRRANPTGGNMTHWVDAGKLEHVDPDEGEEDDDDVPAEGDDSFVYFSKGQRMLVENAGDDGLRELERWGAYNDDARRAVIKRCYALAEALADMAAKLEKQGSGI